MSRKIWTGIGSALGVLVLIFDNETAILGAKDGVELCIRSVIPSLFPLLYLSGLITGTLTSSADKTNCKGNYRRILLLTGYLGGYPVGAQSVAYAYHWRLIAPQEAKRLLVCCNNPGPAFIFGITTSVFAEKWIVWVLWGIHIVSSVIAYWIIPTDKYAPHSCYTQSHPVQTSCLLVSIKNMAQICGWIVLFRTFISILEYRFLVLLPEALQILVFGLLELTNGCIALKEISCMGLRFCMCALFLSFGGCCTLIQTHSVTNRLHTVSYVLGKLLEGCCSFLLAFILQSWILRNTQRYDAPILLLGAVIVLTAACVLIIRKNKNSSRILSSVGV